jgi:guanine deaminase
MERVDHEAFMRRAIAMGRKTGIEDRAGGPFGAVIVRDGEVVGEGYSRVVAEHDATWHAEVASIRDACRRLQTHDLSGCVMYTSGEPCGMCHQAARRARLDRIYYAGPHADTVTYGYGTDGPPRAEGDVPKEELLREEMLPLWQDYRATIGPLPY